MAKRIGLLIVVAGILCVGCGSETTTTADVKEIQAEAQKAVPKDVRQDDASKLNTDLMSLGNRGSDK